jgi:hypothetical protein
MDKRTDGQIDGRTDERMDKMIDGRMDGRTNRWTNRQTETKKEKKEDGWTDVHKALSSHCPGRNPRMSVTNKQTNTMFALIPGATHFRTSIDRRTDKAINI